MPPLIDLTGHQFGRLTVLERTYKKNSRGPYWLCKCSCGNTTIVRSSSLKDGTTQSCGCYNTELCSKINLVHGMSRTPEYRAWTNIIQRCFNPNHPSFKDYGARGITVCKEWKNSFMAFFNDMGKRPSPKLTIERVDNHKGYFSENCIWASRKKQSNNNRRNHLITINGWSLNITQWAKHVGVKAQAIHTRLHLGWTPEKSIFCPIKPHKPYKSNLKNS